jgi:threonine dehydrogenase-like Zn-dependent dehydrogenase
MSEAVETAGVIVAGGATARSGVVVAPGRAELRGVNLPAPGPGQVRLRLEGCGVCGSNLPLWQGRAWFDYPQPPGAPGHEGWGRIDAVGDGVAGWSTGQRVAALSGHAFAEYDLADASALVALPDELAGAPFPGEPLGCAMNVFRRSGIAGGQTVAVVGVGFLGAVLTQLASSAGARVIAVSRRPFSLTVARACGALHALSLEDPARVVEQVRQFTDGALCDRVIEAAGLQSSLDVAGQLTRERGRLIIAGFHQDGPRQVDMFTWNWRGIDVINAHERDPAEYVRGMKEAVAAVLLGTIDPAPLYTHEFPLHRLDAALCALRDRPDGFLKALVRT